MTARATVFISYAREDFAFAEKLCDLLSAEFSPWMDKKNLIGGQDWERALTVAVRQSDFFIFCASANSVAKRGTIQKEIKLALDVWREKLEDDIYFIPVRLERCDVPGHISRFQWIDAFESGWFEKVVRALRYGATRAKSASDLLPISFEERIIANSPEDEFEMKVVYPEFQLQIRQAFPRQMLLFQFSRAESPQISRILKPLKRRASLGFRITFPLPFPYRLFQQR